MSGFSSGGRPNGVMQPQVETRERRRSKVPGAGIGVPRGRRPCAATGRTSPLVPRSERISSEARRSAHARRRREDGRRCSGGVYSGRSQFQRNPRCRHRSRLPGCPIGQPVTPCRCKGARRRCESMGSEPDDRLECRKRGSMARLVARLIRALELLSRYGADS